MKNINLPTTKGLEDSSILKLPADYPRPIFDFKTCYFNLLNQFVEYLFEKNDVLSLHGIR